MTVSQMVSCFQAVADVLENWDNFEGLVWTEDPPIEPGWYWYQVIGAPETHQILYVYPHSRGYLARQAFPTDEASVTSLHCRWAGPIPEPI